jgi:signal transduction histidine kinase
MAAAFSRLDRGGVAPGVSVHVAIRSAAAAVAVAVAALVGLLHPIHVDDLGARAAIETVIAIEALVSAILVLARYLRTRRRRDLVLFTALTAVAVTDFMFSGLASVSGAPSLAFSGGVRQGSEALVTLAFAAAAFAPGTTVAGSKRRALGLALAAAGGVIALGLLIELMTGAPVASPRSPETGLAAAATHPVMLGEAMLSSAVLVISGIGFFSRPGTSNCLLAVASFVLAAARLQYLSLPIVAMDWLTAREGLRLIAFALLLTAAVCEAATLRRRALNEALIAERERIARDLHDGLAQDLAYIALQSQRLALNLGSDHPLPVAARRALAASRGVIVDLSASDAASAGDALRTVAAELQTRHDVKINVSEPDGRGDDGLDAGRREELVRIAREAILNAIRHGDARRIDVALGRHGSGPLLRVCDDGTGVADAAVQHGNGFGVRMMRARASSFGGRLAIRRRSAGGTELEVVCSACAAHGGSRSASGRCRG